MTGRDGRALRAVRGAQLSMADQLMNTPDKQATKNHPEGEKDEEAFNRISTLVSIYLIVSQFQINEVEPGLKLD